MKKREKNEKTKKIKKLKFKTKKSGNKKELKKQQLIFSLIVLLILLVFFIAFGFLVTLITAIGIGGILACAKLITKLQQKKKTRKAVNIVLIVILAMGILGLLLASAFLIFVIIRAPKFDPALLDSPEVSLMFDKDGNEFAKLGSEMREKVTYDELPQVLIDAVVATEDSRFFQHNGFDAPRFLSATMGQLKSGGAGGASTLSMQVIKNSFTSTEASGIAGIIRKFTDIYLAVFKLEKNYTKEQIIEFYVNNHFLGGNIYGVQEASYAYFGKDVKDLNLSEASVIAGMFQSPNYFRPNVNPKNATTRRANVLRLMNRHGYITKEQWNLAAEIPIESLTIEAASANANPYQGYIDTVASEMERRFNVNPYITPVLVYTSMDRSKQDGLNRVFSGEAFNWVDDKIQSGVAVLDTTNGKIIAIGNGRNRSGANTFNYATDINRQPGSSAKPLFDYGPGIEYNDWSTAEMFNDKPYTYSNGQPIRNWDNKNMGWMTLRRALAISRNVPALMAFQQTDNKKIIEFVERLGITPEIENGRIHEAHSIGAFTGVSPLQMAAAYAAFGNSGYYNEPTAINKFQYRETGRTEEIKTKRVEAMSDATAFMITSVLQDVSLIPGPLPSNVAAKTGTTNYDTATMNRHNLPGDAIRDSWVVGYSTKTTIGMWYGYDFIDREYVMRNLPSSTAKDRLFLAIAENVFEKNREEFKMPDSVVKLPIIIGSNPPRVAGAGSGNVTYELFKKGHEPTNKVEESPRLATPTGFTGTYSSGKVNLSWNGVSRLENDSNFGAFGYNLYFGNTLIGFTESTSFTWATDNPWGTYKVVATYRSFDGAQSNPATFTLEEKVADNITSTPIPQTSTIGSNVPTAGISSLFTIKNNNADITSQVTNLRIVSISGPPGSSINTGNSVFDVAGTFRVTYSIEFNGKTHTLSPVEFTVS